MHFMDTPAREVPYCLSEYLYRHNVISSILFQICISAFLIVRSSNLLLKL